MNNQFNENYSSSSGNGFINGAHPTNRGHIKSVESSPQEYEFSVSWLLAQGWYYKWPLLFFIIFFGVLSFLIALNIQPVYETSGTLLINESKNRYSYAGSDLSNLLTTSYGLGMGSSFVNQLEIIRSRRIATEIANQLLLDPVMANGSMHPILWKVYPKDSTYIDKEQLVKRIRSKLDVRRKQNNADLAEVIFQSYSPLEAANLVNITMNTYTEVSTKQNTQSARSAREFLASQRSNMAEELRKAEEDLKAFQEKTGFLTVETQASGNFEQLAKLEQKKEEQQINLISINIAINNYEEELQRLMPNFSENFAENMSPMLAKLQAKLADLEAERIVLLANNPELEEEPNHEPQLIDLNKQIGALKNTIRTRANILLSSDSSGIGFLSGAEGTERITALRQNLIRARIEKAQAEAQINVIEELVAHEESEFDQIPDDILQLARLKRDLAMKESLYKTIAQQYAETSLWEETQSGAGIPLDYATIPKIPVSPNIFFYILSGLFTGFVVGFCYIYLRIETNTKIDSPDRLVELPYPLLSVIPDFNQESAYQEFISGKGQNTYKINANWITFYDTNSLSAEAFRRLQNNILYSRPDVSLKTLMVTSCEQGEGKTSVSLNLATTLTEAGKKVLIVDTDLRRPNLHNLASLSKSPGLMDVVFEGKSLKESIQNTLHDNVSILSVGNRPPNPSAVLRSEKMVQIIKSLRQTYDYILFDTPPLGIVGDAAPLIQYIEGVVVVSKFRTTEIVQLNKLIHDLEYLKAPILGTVLTGFNPNKSTYTYYHNLRYNYNYKSYEQYVDNI